MNCANCGTPLNGAQTCPNCGALNIGFTPDPNQAPNAIQQVAADPKQGPTQATNEQVNMSSDLGIEELPDETLNVSESMAPPTLDINQENLQANEVGTDIANASNTSTYSPEELEHQKQMQEEAIERKKQDVNIEIPQNNGPIENINMPTDGTAPSIDSETPTVGEIKPAEEEVQTTIKFGKKNLKVNLGKRSIPGKLAIVGGIVILIIGILLGSTLFGKKVYTPTVNNPGNQTKIDKVSDGKNNTTLAGNFIFKIPTSYTYDKQYNGLVVYDKDDTFRIYIRGSVGSYDDFASAKTSIKKTLENQNMSVNDIKELSINDSNFVVAEVTKNMINYVIAYTNAPEENYIFYIEIISSNNTDIASYLEYANDITTNAEYAENTSQMETISVLDMFELTKKAVETYRDTSSNS